jgi:hypothetical protein
MDKLDLLKQQKWGTTEERRASMQEQARQFDAQSEAAQLRAALEATRKSNNEQRAKIDHFITVLNTIGTTIYTQGKGAKWEGSLLTLIREEMDKLTKTP